MDDVLTIPSVEDAAQLKLTLTQCIAEVDHLQELMRQDDIWIARSQARTRALMAEIDEMMNDGAEGSLSHVETAGRLCQTNRVSHAGHAEELRAITPHRKNEPGSLLEDTYDKQS